MEKVEKVEKIEKVEKVEKATGGGVPYIDAPFLIFFDFFGRKIFGAEKANLRTRIPRDR